jgi:hypothetical protein
VLLAFEAGQRERLFFSRRPPSPDGGLAGETPREWLGEPRRDAGLYVMALSDSVRRVVTYDADQLRQFLELWRREDGNLSLDQMEALADWQETPEGVREALQPAIERGRRYPARTAPAPLTPKQAEEQRNQGLLEEPEESRLLGERLAAFIRSAFSSKR